MSKEAKQVARAYYDAMNSKDLDAIMALYAKGARTWVLGEGPYAGYNEVSRELLGGFLEAFDIKFTIVSMLSEGDVVSMEVESEGHARRCTLLESLSQSRDDPGRENRGAQRVFRYGEGRRLIRSRPPAS